MEVAHTVIHQMAVINIQSPRLNLIESFIDCLKYKLQPTIFHLPFCNKMTKEVDVSYNKSQCQGANKFSTEGAGRAGVFVTKGGKMESLGYLRPDPG
jgi:hypothetical protein